MKFVCVTKWSDDEGTAFERHHEREAANDNDAYERERAHNARRYFGGMGEEGWNWEIQSVSVLG